MKIGGNLEHVGFFLDGLFLHRIVYKGIVRKKIENVRIRQRRRRAQSEIEDLEFSSRSNNMGVIGEICPFR